MAVIGAIQLEMKLDWCSVSIHAGNGEAPTAISKRTSGSIVIRWRRHAITNSLCSACTHNAHAHEWNAKMQHFELNSVQWHLIAPCVSRR